MTNQRLLTPSKITAWLDCAHYLTLKNQLEDGTLKLAGGGFGEMAQMLMEKGLEHEDACLAEYEADPTRTVYRVPERGEHESHAAWTARVGNPMADGHDVIFQMPFVHDGMRGIADFLVRVDDPESGITRYEPVDSKLARVGAKPGHVLQLCFYAEAIEALTGVAPVDLHVWLGSGDVETIRRHDVIAYWRRLRRQLAVVVDGDPVTAATVPEQCAHCAICEFAEVCTAAWRAEDSLLYVAGIRRRDREALVAGGVSTLAHLAGHDQEVEALLPERRVTITTQAALQVEARLMGEGARPPVRHLPQADGPTGFAAMPEPDDGDVFLDYEGHPFWRADTGLFFLFGMLLKNTAGEWVYETIWAHDLDEERAATAELIDRFATRRQANPGMHVYHYNHTERSALAALARDHRVGEEVLAELVDTGLFVDLLDVIRHSMQVGAESYGLKHLELLTPYERSHDIDKGAGAVVEYERYTKDGSADRLARIATYNRDDVEATRALRDWLVGVRPDELPWRDARFELSDPKVPELGPQAMALRASDVPAERLLGDLLGYWQREKRAAFMDMGLKAQRDTSQQLDDPEAIGGLTFVDSRERLGKKGQVLTGREFSYSMPPQRIGRKLKAGADVVFDRGDSRLAFGTIEDIDGEDGTLSFKASDDTPVASAVVLNTWVRITSKEQALSAFAGAVIEGGASSSSSVQCALLESRAPAFIAGHGPQGGTFTDDLGSILDWVPHLDHSYVAIQGPPGTGKTYTGAHVVHRLVREGKRVGITAIGHEAVANLLKDVVAVFTAKGDIDLLRAVRRSDTPIPEMKGVERAADNAKAAHSRYNVVAGTSFLFAPKDMQQSPVDVLIIDEAGQMSLADALVCAGAAENVILLGDPLQLAQVAQATHPGHAGDSVLDHVLDGRATIPDDKGVFLSVTRRMHPDVCGFISEQIYEGRLTSHESCVGQRTSAGTGLRHLRAEHAGCSTESSVEAVMIASTVRELIGTDWTDQHGTTKPLTVDDVIVVAPYNDQVARVREVLAADALTRSVPVGTVDKFQGQEAAVVFFSMTSSSSEDMPRGPEFLFSRNRLNVAISRARALAYLVCTDDLLNSRARDVEDMKLISTLCALEEHCTPH